ncbi:hypothetical protein BV22DRAFT_1044810, partial [Leucogyrophana mollusca]
MSSQAAVNATSPPRRQTHAQNADVHPGQIQLDAEKEAAAEELKANPGRKPRARKAKPVNTETPEEQGIRMDASAAHIANIEKQMLAEQSQATASKPKAVRPPARAKGMKTPTGTTAKEAGESPVDSSVLKEQEGGDSEEEVQPEVGKKRGKVTKPSLREA